MVARADSRNDASCLVLDNLESPNLISWSARQQATTIVHSGHDKALNCSFGGIRCEELANLANIAEVKVARSDDTGYLISHREMFVKENSKNSYTPRRTDDMSIDSEG